MEGETIDKNTNITIKCFKCGNGYTMDMMRMDPSGKSLICRYCLDRRPIPKENKATPPLQKELKKQTEVEVDEYFCKECKYNFKRGKSVSVSACPYCGSSGTVMHKGSTARIIADAAKMKDKW